MSPINIRVRLVEPEDVQLMIQVYEDAFSDSLFYSRCFPASDPESAKGTAWYVSSGLADPDSHMAIAEDVSSGEPILAGWVRWTRQPLPEPNSKPATPPPVFTEKDFPQNGDPELAARFFKATSEATRRYTAGRPVWRLESIVVRKDCQRRGIGGELMRFGLEKVDQDGWIAYLNGQPDAYALYKRFGFETLHASDFGDGITTRHMLREGRGKPKDD